MVHLSPTSQLASDAFILHLANYQKELAQRRLDAVPPKPTRAVGESTASTFPPLVVELVCDSLREDMSLQEGFMGFPAPLLGEQVIQDCRRLRLQSEERELLKAMSVVARAWTRPSQAALRCRIDINYPSGMKRFLRSSFCGPWVQELQYTMRTGASREATPLLPVLARVPFLRAFSFSMANLERDVGRLSLTPVLSSIPVSLQALHVQLNCWADDTLDQLFDSVSNLHNLTTLSIMGYCFKTLTFADKPPSSRVLQKSPPASLKRVLLEFQTIAKDAVPHLSWLFAPREGYALRELRLRHVSTLYVLGVKDIVLALLPMLAPILPDLKVLEVRLSMCVPDWPSMLYCPRSFQSLVERCTALEELHANVIDVSGPLLQLPRSLRRLHVFKTFDAEDSAAADDAKLVPLLTPLLAHRNLRAVLVSELDDYEDENRLCKTEELCKSAGVEYTVTDSEDGSDCTWRRFRVV